jgi:hypothetical protein
VLAFPYGFAVLLYLEGGRLGGAEGNPARDDVVQSDVPIGVDAPLLPDLLLDLELGHGDALGRETFEPHMQRIERFRIEESGDPLARQVGSLDHDAGYAVRGRVGGDRHIIEGDGLARLRQRHAPQGATNPPGADLGADAGDELDADTPATRLDEPARQDQRRRGGRTSEA